MCAIFHDHILLKRYSLVGREELKEFTKYMVDYLCWREEWKINKELFMEAGGAFNNNIQ